MHTTHRALAVFLFLCAGCEPADACEADVVAADGSLWVKACDWPAYAEMADWPSISHAVDTGLLVPAQDDCFEMSFADGSICVLDVDGHDVLARPVDQVGPFQVGPCQFAAPWDSMVSNADGICWVVGAVHAYRVKP